jgi:hypothetical protein
VGVDDQYLLLRRVAVRSTPAPSPE